MERRALTDKTHQIIDFDNNPACTNFNSWNSFEDLSGKISYRHKRKER